MSIGNNLSYISAWLQRFWLKLWALDRRDKWPNSLPHKPLESQFWIPSASANIPSPKRCPDRSPVTNKFNLQFSCFSAFQLFGKASFFNLKILPFYNSVAHYERGLLLSTMVASFPYKFIFLLYLVMPKINGTKYIGSDQIELISIY